MTTADRDMILDLIVDAAYCMPGEPDRCEAIREATRQFCQAFPAEAAAYAESHARDFATMDQMSPPAPYPLRPAPVRDETYDWEDVPF